MRFTSNFIYHVCFLSTLVACNSNAQQTELTVTEFEKAIAQNNIQVLDVRTAAEYQTGHLKNALQADWNNEAEFRERASALDKHKPVYTYCLVGGRSAAAVKWLKKNGYTAYNLTGGITAWKKSEKPLEQAISITQISLQEYLAKIPTDKTVLVDFGAGWCPPCKKMNPVLDTLVKTNGSQFVLVKIDGGEQTAICKELNIDGFPTFIIYKQGKEIWRKQGVVEINEFVEKL